MNPKERVTLLLYILMRDHIPAGTIANIQINHLALAEGVGGAAYSNGHLAAYAREIAEVLLEEKL